jgi:hypothetical protein
MTCFLRRPDLDPKSAPWVWLALAISATSCTEPSYPVAVADSAVQHEGRDGEAGASVSAPDNSAPDGSAKGGGAAMAEPASDASAATTSDASMPRPPSLEADAGALAHVLPEWAKPLLGRYAARAFAFKQDDFPTVTRAQDVFLAQFSFDEETGVTLRSKICESSAQNNLATLRLIDPTQMPERVEHVVFASLEQRWSSEGPASTVGYTREPPAACLDKLGQSVPKVPAQTWIDGDSCRCTQASADPVVNDCRLLDPDADGKPGFSFKLRGSAPPLGDTTIYAASESSTHYVNGQVSSDGKQHDANVMGGERPFQLGCSPASCAEIDKIATYCPVVFNPVRFVRVDEVMNCQTIMANLDRLFPDAPPPIAARCY